MGKIVVGYGYWRLIWLLGYGLRAWAAMDDQKHVQSECEYTTYPKLCVRTLLGSGPGPGRSKLDIPFALVSKTLSETCRLQLRNIPKSITSQLATHAAHDHLVRGTYHYQIRPS